MNAKELERKWTLGLLMLGLVILLWVLSSFLINIIFEDDSYRKPFFITYINTASFIFYLIPTFSNVIRKYIKDRKWSIRKELILEEEGETENVASSDDSNHSNNIQNNNEPTVETSLLPRYSVSNTVNIRLSLKDTVKLSAQFCILWFLANFATNASLAYTSVASQTMLSSTSSFFTLFIGALGNVETVTTSKLFGSILSFLGIALVTQSDSFQGHLPIKPVDVNFGEPTDDLSSWNSLIGNSLAIAGAMFYGIYSTLLKIKVRDENMINMKFFFGFVGLFTLLFMWPSLIILHYMRWERFVIPTNPKVIFIILLNMSITFVSDYFWAKAMLLTTPLTVTVGLSITIPVAMFGDILFKHKTMPLEYLLGGSLILGSFFIISKTTEAKEEVELQHDDQQLNAE